LNKLKYFRFISNLTLEDLSKKTNLSVGYLSHLENGSRENPSKEAMEKIATAFNKSVPEVFFTELTAEESQELLKRGYNDSKSSKTEIEEGCVTK